MLLREAAKEYKWNLNYGGIALMWRGGCIIRRCVCLSVCVCVCVFSNILEVQPIFMSLWAETMLCSSYIYMWQSCVSNRHCFVAFFDYVTAF